MPALLDRILETLLQRNATTCWIETGRPVRVVIAGEIRELQTGPIANEIEDFVMALFDLQDWKRLFGTGCDVRGNASYGVNTMTMSVHACKTLKGYFLELRPLTSNNECSCPKD